MAEPTYAQYLAVLNDELLNDTSGFGPFVNNVNLYQSQAENFNTDDQTTAKLYFDSEDFQKLIDADDFDNLSVGRRDYWVARIGSAEPFQSDFETIAAFTTDFGGTSTDANRVGATVPIRRIDVALTAAGYSPDDGAPNYQFGFSPTGADITEAWAL